MRLLKILRLLVVAFGIPFVILFYFARFSMQQSIVVALIAGWLEWVMETRVPRPTTRFRPYSVGIRPRWYEIVTDFKLISEPEEWRAILETLRKLPSTEYCILRDGVRFSVLHEDNEVDDFLGSERALLFLGHQHEFSTEIDRAEFMDPIKIEYQSRSDVSTDILKGIHGDESSRSYVPQFFVKYGLPGGGGLKLGLIVPDWWWERKKVICPEAVHETTDHLTGQVELVLAEIPPSEFDGYHQLVWWGNPFLRPPNSFARREEERTKLGWKAVEHSHNSEMRVRWSDSIEHKYFTLYHWAI